MKLIRCGEAGAERPGLLLADGMRVAAPDCCRDYDERFFASGGVDRLREWAAGDLSGTEAVPEEVRWGAAVSGWRSEVGGQGLAVGGWRLAVGGWRLAVGAVRLRAR
jgi:hypothetical protein